MERGLPGCQKLAKLMLSLRYMMPALPHGMAWGFSGWADPRSIDNTYGNMCSLLH